MDILQFTSLNLYNIVKICNGQASYVDLCDTLCLLLMVFINSIQNCIAICRLGIDTDVLCVKQFIILVLRHIVQCL
jgi:hypothetical protein